LGFLNRPGIREADFGAQYTHRPREGWLRSISSGFDAECAEGLDGELESQSVSYGLIGLESRFGDELEIEIEAEQDVLDEDFEISDGVIVPQAHYSFRNASVEFETADQRKVWGGAGVQTGDFYGGERREAEVEINWRPSGRFRAGLGYEWNDIDLPGGSFVTRLASFTTEVAFSAKLSWVTRIQYDNDSDRVGVNLRLHWIPQAGREAFFVLNHDLKRDFDVNLDNRFHSEVNDTVLKYSYTFRF
jgi:hypothetical protein